MECNVSKHSSIKITVAASQGILGKNLFGMSWCLSSEILYSRILGRPIFGQLPAKSHNRKLRHNKMRTSLFVVCKMWQ